ncbi:hypothetical protein [Streptacidiphilus sp. MAP12-20]|uniref:hypothetical protein n=1 Tax=Streptacidiphilus sp. MAP12-20 TaxID=3156299 RepID=UPI0035187526
MTDPGPITTSALTITRILGDSPFAPIGRPTAVARSTRHNAVVVGGDLGAMQWSGRLLNGHARQYRIGVFSLDSLRCRTVTSSRWPVSVVAIHPSLPLAAVGTGQYDGGYSFEGELLLVDLTTGRSASVLQHGREIRSLDWSSTSTLSVIASPFDDWEDDEAHTHGYAFSLACDDWTTVPDRAFTTQQQVGPRVPCTRPDDGAMAEQSLAEICRAHGLSWAPRRQVWAVESHGDGRVLAALDGVAAESWLPDGEQAWSIPDGVGGRQLHLASDGRSAWVTVPGRYVRTERGWHDLPTRVDRLSLEDGRVLETLDTDGPAVVTANRDGRLGLRDTRRMIPTGHPEPATRLISSDDPHEELGRVRLSGYDAVNHYLAVRRSPALLFLAGAGPHHHLDKAVTTVDLPDDGSEPTVRALFPLEWDTERNGHLFGGPGAWLNDDLGSSVVHAGTVHNGAGLLPGNAFVVRRSLPGGEPNWVFAADDAPTALDTDGATVYVAFANGELIALDAHTGEVRWRYRIKVDGVDGVALSLALSDTGTILLGTWDGRILECTVLG